MEVGDTPHPPAGALCAAAAGLPSPAHPSPMYPSLFMTSLPAEVPHQRLHPAAGGAAAVCEPAHHGPRGGGGQAHRRHQRRAGALSRGGIADCGHVLWVVGPCPSATSAAAWSTTERCKGETVLLHLCLVSFGTGQWPVARPSGDISGGLERYQEVRLLRRAVGL